MLIFDSEIEGDGLESLFFFISLKGSFFSALSFSIFFTSYLPFPIAIYSGYEKSELLK